MGFLQAGCSEVEDAARAAAALGGRCAAGGDFASQTKEGDAWRPLQVVRAVGWAEEQGLRESMEDGMLAIENFAGQRGAWLLGVYDGHGGRQTVDFLLTHLHEEIKRQVCARAARARDKLLCDADWRNLFESPAFQTSAALRCPLALCSDEDIAEALAAAFKSTDEALLRAGIQESGATACVCLLRPSLRTDVSCGDADSFPPQQKTPAARLGFQVHTSHLGDTRALLIFTDGFCLRLTSSTDHKASAAEEMNRVESVGGYVIGERVNGMLAIGRAFGDWTLKLGPHAVRSCARAAAAGPGIPATLVVSNVPDVSSETLYPTRETSPPESASSTAEDRALADSKHTRLVNSGGGRSSRVSRSPSADKGAAARAAEPLMLLLGCDGLFDVCEDRVVAAIAVGVIRAVATEELAASEADAAEAVARVLVREAIDLRGSGDNVSVAVAMLQPLSRLKSERSLLGEEVGNREPLSSRTAASFPSVFCAAGATPGGGEAASSPPSPSTAASRESSAEGTASREASGGGGLGSLGSRASPLQESFSSAPPREAALQACSSPSPASAAILGRGLPNAPRQQGQATRPLDDSHAERRLKLLKELQRRQLLAPLAEDVDEDALLRLLKDHQLRRQDTRVSAAAAFP